MPGDPRTLQIIDAVVAQLEAITGSDYHHAVKDVRRGKRSIPKMFPTLDVVWGGNTRIDEAGVAGLEYQERQLVLTIFGWVSDASGPQAAAARLDQDIQKAMHVDEFFGDLVQVLEYGGTVSVLGEDQLAHIGRVEVTFSLTHGANRKDPAAIPLG